MKNLFKIVLMLFAVIMFTACNNTPAEEVSEKETVSTEVENHAVETEESTPVEATEEVKEAAEVKAVTVEVEKKTKDNKPEQLVKEPQTEQAPLTEKAKVIEVEEVAPGPKTK